MSKTALNRRVLHLDDDPNTFTAIEGALTGQGWDVEHTATIGACMQAIRTQAFDAMIIDRTLPEGDGLDMLRQMRNEGIATPAIIVSALGDVDNRVLGLTSGADDYLSKPFSTPELVARLSNLLNRGNRPTGTVLHVGPLTLDIEGHRMERGNRNETLLPRETRLLAYLMRHPDTLLTRAMLLRDVWNFNLSNETNVIDVHMGKLRKKVDFPDEPQLIRTIKGAGFMFVAQ